MRDGREENKMADAEDKPIEHVRDGALAQPATFEDAIRAEAQRVADLVISKQRDYGKGNILAFGEFGVVVRLNDKISRIANLTQSGEGTFALPMGGGESDA